MNPATIRIRPARGVRLSERGKLLLSRVDGAHIGKGDKLVSERLTTNNCTRLQSAVAGV